MLKYGKALEFEVPELKLVKPQVDDARMVHASVGERGRLIAACPDEIRGVVEFAFNTGMRIGEVFGLDWSAVGEVGATVVSKKGKGSKRFKRVVPLNKAAVAAMGERPRGGGLVFKTPTGSAWDRSSFAKRFKVAREKAGLVDFRPYDMRHTFATMLMARGTNLKVVGDLLGHRSITMTSRYVHVTPDQTVKAVSLLDEGAEDTDSSPQG